MEVIRRSWILALGVMAAGCTGNDLSDLQAYVQEVRGRGEAPIDPIPEIKQPEFYAYRSRAEELRDPFTPELPKEETAQSGGNGLKPDELRQKEELEVFPLDTLRMVGTVARDDSQWALVQNKEGIIFRVKPGNYMGQNHGRITAVFDDRIELVEIVPDRAGGYVEQTAQLSLGE